MQGSSTVLKLSHALNKVLFEEQILQFWVRVVCASRFGSDLHAYQDKTPLFMKKQNIMYGRWSSFRASTSFCVFAAYLTISQPI